MTKISWKTGGLAVVVLVVALVAGALVAQALPSSLEVGADAARFSGADVASRVAELADFDADYRRWDAVLGVPVGSSAANVAVSRNLSGDLHITLDLSDFGTDMIRLNGTDLMLERRSFGQPNGPGQRFERRGGAIHATVRSADGSTRELDFDYPVPVFEPSVLELPLGLLDLDAVSEGHLAWSNFGDVEDHWLPFRVLGREIIDAAGKQFDTRIVRVAFPGGRQRDYWIAPEPPYKIRMVSYDRGRLLTSGWELESVERGS